DLTIGSSSVVGPVVTSPGDRTYHSVGSQQRVLAACAGRLCWSIVLVARAGQ
ncbi:MAG: hypothetical protein ACI9ME_001994, partial [Ilumatobacter sp.]